LEKKKSRKSKRIRQKELSKTQGKMEGAGFSVGQKEQAKACSYNDFPKPKAAIKDKGKRRRRIYNTSLETTKRDFFNMRLLQNITYTIHRPFCANITRRPARLQKLGSRLQALQLYQAQQRTEAVGKINIWTRAIGFCVVQHAEIAATLLGWRVLRCTPKDVHSKETVAMLRQALNEK